MTYQRELLFSIALAAGLMSTALEAEDDQYTLTQSPYFNTAGYKLVGWNDLGMHCMDGKDYSVFAVLPPYNTIHAHLMDPTGKLITTGTGYAVTYQAVSDPLTNSINTTSVPKTNFWQYAQKLGFGPLQPDQGLKGAFMPGPGNTPQPMAFSVTDNTFTTAGIPITPYADAAISPYPANYFPMMRLVAKTHQAQCSRPPISCCRLPTR